MSMKSTSEREPEAEQRRVSGQPESWLQRMQHRLADRDKAPRQIWFPLDERASYIEKGDEKQHGELSRSINRVVLVLVGYCFFCALALSTPDVSLIASGASIRVPFANTEVAFSSFLTLGPAVLLGIAFYLHIFVGQLAKLSLRVLGGQRLPFAFNIDTIAGRWFAEFAFYWLVPLMLHGFAYKASPRPAEGPLLAALSWLGTLLFLLLQTRRAAYRPPSAYSRVVRVGVLVGTLVAAFSLATGHNMFRRQLYLFGVELNGEDLRRVSLSEAIMAEAHLSKADLTGTRMRNADLTYADLSVAKMGAADLRGAFVGGANFHGAELRHADLRDTMALTYRPLLPLEREAGGILQTEAGDFLAVKSRPSAYEKSPRAPDFTNANLTDADLRRATLQGGDFRGAIVRGASFVDTDLRDANLSELDLSGIDMTRARLEGAWLVGADLSRTDLQDADLSGTDLTGARLTREQLDVTQGDTRTRLPVGFAPPPHWVQ